MRVGIEGFTPLEQAKLRAKREKERQELVKAIEEKLKEIQRGQ